MDATRHLLLMMCQPFHTVECYEVGPRGFKGSRDQQRIGQPIATACESGVWKVGVCTRGEVVLRLVLTCMLPLLLPCLSACLPPCLLVLPACLPPCPALPACLACLSCLPARPACLSCVLTQLPLYQPSPEEQADPRLYAANVRDYMLQHSRAVMGPAALKPSEGGFLLILSLGRGWVSLGRGWGFE